MADTLNITANVTEGQAVSSSVDEGVSITTNVVESTTVTANVATGAKGDKGDPGANGQGVPTGGTAGQILTKDSSTDYDTSWQDPTGAVDSVNGQTGVVVLNADDIDDTSTTHKFATASQLSNADTAVQPGDLAAVATSGDYTDLTNKPSIPDELTDLDTTVTGSQLNSMKSKLDNIEANADVTDATNVAAAGAVMESDTSTASMSFVVDEDTLSSNSDTKVPTQQSVKAYVDTQVGGLDHGGLAGLSDDDHTQYALLAGRSGGQTLSGSSAEDEHLTLKANAAAFNTNSNTGKIKWIDQVQNDGGFTISHNNGAFFKEWYYYAHRHTGTITLQSGANLGTYVTVLNDATFVWDAAQIFSSIQLFDARPTLEPTISSNTTDNTTNYRMFFGYPQLKPNISTASTWTGVSFGVYIASPQVGIKTGSHSSAAVVMPRMYSFASSGVAVGAQTTVTDLSHVFIQNVTNLGTITRQIGVEIEALTGGTTDIGIRIAKADTYSLQLSDTGGTAAGGITFGTDTNIYRSAANTLKTDDNFTSLGSQIFGAAGTNTDLKKFGNTAGDEFYVGTNAAMRIQRSAGSSEAFGTQINGDTARRVLINSSGVISFGDGSAAQDTNIYRSAANTLKTDDLFVAGGGLRIDTAAVAETPTATHTVTVNLNGTNYKLLCVAA